MSESVLGKVLEDGYHERSNLQPGYVEKRACRKITYINKGSLDPFQAKKR